MHDEWLIRELISLNLVNSQQVKKIQDIKKKTNQAYEVIVVQLGIVKQQQLESIKGSSLQTYSPQEEKPTKIQQVQFDRYTLEKKIGEGQFGAVFLAFDNEWNRKVAIKILKPGYGDEKSIKRFQREAQAISQLNHPGIVKIYEFGHCQNQNFYTMSYVEGKSLEQILKEEKRLPSRKAVRLILSVAEIIQHAHEHDIIHRDIKPENIMLDKNGGVYLMDFGLAKSTHGTKLSQTGLIAGTPAYMSPEQARGKRLDKRCDIYGLGATLYELLTGQVPFPGNNSTQVLVDILRKKPTAPHTLNLKVPKTVEHICLKCLEKDKDRRYASAQSLADEMRSFLLGKSKVVFSLKKIACYVVVVLLMSLALGYVYIENVRLRSELKEYQEKQKEQKKENPQIIKLWNRYHETQENDDKIKILTEIKSKYLQRETKSKDSKNKKKSDDSEAQTKPNDFEIPEKWYEELVKCREKYLQQKYIPLSDGEKFRQWRSFFSNDKDINKILLKDFFEKQQSIAIDIINTINKQATIALEDKKKLVDYSKIVDDLAWSKQIAKENYVTLPDNWRENWKANLKEEKHGLQKRYRQIKSNYQRVMAIHSYYIRSNIRGDKTNKGWLYKELKKSPKNCVKEFWGYYKKTKNKCKKHAIIKMIEKVQRIADVLKRPIDLNEKLKEDIKTAQDEATSFFLQEKRFLYCHYFQNHYYVFFFSQKSWEEAKKMCEKMGGHLLTLETEEENKQILEEIQRMRHDTDTPLNRYWLGLFQKDTKQEPRGGWCWVTGEEVTFEGWSNTEPNNSGGYEHHGELSGRFWNDLSQNAALPFICEFDADVE